MLKPCFFFVSILSGSKFFRTEKGLTKNTGFNNCSGLLFVQNTKDDQLHFELYWPSKDVAKLYFLGTNLNDSYK